MKRNIQLEEIVKKQEDLERKIIDLTNVSLSNILLLVMNYKYNL